VAHALVRAASPLLATPLTSAFLQCEYEFMFTIWVRSIFTGLVLWTAGTIVIRLAGKGLLQPERAGRTLGLYLVSFLLMFLLAPRICRRLGAPRELWPQAATLLILPTLILDPFSCAFFNTVFPNVDPGAAGTFGGWMLICCGGGLAGVWRKA